MKNLSLEELMNVEVATVTTASKVPEKATDAPATAIVVTAQDIQHRGYRFLKDVLRDLPGMETTENYFTEIGTLVPVRGIVGNNKIIVLVNGMLVNPPGGEYFPFRSDFSVRDVEQVEVIYGPNSTLYGQDAISAVINVKTKKPVAGKLGELALDGGAYGERDGWLTFGKTFGADHGISLSGYFHYHDSSRTHLDQDYPAWWANYLPIANHDTGLGQHHYAETPFREDYGLNGFARLEGENWSVQYFHRESERSSAEGYSTNLPFDPAAGTSPGIGFLKHAIWGDHSDVVEARHTLPISDTLKLESALDYNHYKIDPGTLYVEPEPAPGPPGGANQTAWYLFDRKFGRGNGVTLEETLHWQVAPTLSLLSGVYAGYFDILPKATRPLPTDQISNLLLPPGLGLRSTDFVYYGANDFTGAPTTIPRSIRETYETYAGYLEMNWQVTPKLKLVGGTRVTADTRVSEIPVTPRASVIYNLTDKVTAKYIFSRAFVAPAPYFSDLTFDDGVHLARNNPNSLRPETAYSNEVNLSYAEKNLNLGMSVYYGEQANLILAPEQVTNANVVQSAPVYLLLPNGTLSPRTLVQAANGGTSRNVGFDLYGRETIGQVSPWFSYSYVDFEQTTDKGTTGLPGISRHNGRLGVTVEVTPKLFVTPSLVIRSTPENIRNPGNLRHELNTPYEINLAVQYNIQPNMRLFAEVRNLTNHKYALGDLVGSAYPQEGIHGVVGFQLEY